MVYDLPKHKGTYQERYSALGIYTTFPFPFFPLTPLYQLEEYFKQHPCDFIEVAPKMICNGIPHLEKHFQDIIDMGGEGIILRDPSSPYEPGRSRGYLKHKVTYLYCSIQFFTFYQHNLF